MLSIVGTYCGSRAILICYPNYSRNNNGTEGGKTILNGNKNAHYLNYILNSIC